MTLPAIQTHHGRFTLLELDNPVRMANELGLDFSLEPNQSVVKELVAQVLAELTPEVSGIVLDGEVGLSQVEHKAQTAGLLLRLEEVRPEVDPLALPSLDQEWGIEQIVNNFGVVKLELFYHPAEEQAMIKKQWLAEIFDYCQYQHAQLLLKMRLYAPPGILLDAAAFQEVQLEAAQELGRSCSLLALDSPPNALAAATLTAELDIPWIVHSGDQVYGQFKEAVREALENGAQGYLAGEAVWRDLYTYKRKDMGIDLEKALHFLQTVARDRVIELDRIVGEQPHLA